MDLVLVRHAEPVDHSLGRCYGRLDVELSPAGRTQSRRLAAALACLPVAAVVSSPLRRARDTARPIAELHGLGVQILEGLSELDFGEVEGMTYDEIAASRPRLYAQWMSAPTTVAFPGGESYVELQARATAAVSGLRAGFDGRTVVAVTHGGVVRALLSNVLAVPGDRVFRLVIDPASITRVTWQDDVPIVGCVNVAASLDA
jgi:alpha-ribazole phosphatase